MVTHSGWHLRSGQYIPPEITSQIMGHRRTATARYGAVRRRIANVLRRRTPARGSRQRTMNPGRQRFYRRQNRGGRLTWY